jgi:hypothetical protein
LTNSTNNITVATTTTAGRLLIANATGTQPTFQQVNISNSNSITGILPTNFGGTGTITNTGTGANVKSITPTLVTPILGAATASNLIVTGGDSCLTVNGTINPIRGVTTVTQKSCNITLANTLDSNQIVIGMAGNNDYPWFQVGAAQIITQSAKDIFFAPNTVVAMRLKVGGIVQIPNYPSTILGTDSSGNIQSTTSSGTGSVVLASSPTITNAILDTGAVAPFAGNFRALVTGAGGQISGASGVVADSVLMSNGLSSSPTFQQVKLESSVTGVLPVANGGTGTTTGFIMPTQTFLTSGTSYNTPAGCTYIEATVIGSGGGGGGANGATFNPFGGGGGGGGGLVTCLMFPGSYTYSIGDGGIGGSGSNFAGATDGSNGGTTTFSGGSTPLTITIVGGGGGLAGQQTLTNTDGGSGGFQSAAPTNAFTCTGSGGGGGFRADFGASVQLLSGAGGSSPFGGGAPGFSRAAATSGISGKGFGGGGSGGGLSSAGGNGFKGCILIKEYYK